jgi:TRAP-type C4-dicarboxylate transport system permease small subunit
VSGWFGMSSALAAVPAAAGAVPPGGASSHGEVPLAWLHPGAPFLLVLAALITIALLLRLFAVRRLGRERFVQGCRVLEQWILTVLFLGILASSMLQIFMRNVLHTGFLWTEPMARYLVLWIAFFGALTATSRARHLAIDIVALVLSPRRRAVLQRSVAVIAAVVCAVLANGAYTYLQQEFGFGKEAFLGLRTWLVQSILLFGFCLLSYRFLVMALFGLTPDENEMPAVGERVL